jgi:hypothetical protein
MDDLFERARAVLRDGNGLRSGTFEVQWGLAELRFWNQVSDTKEGDWPRTMATRVERRFGASFNYQQLSRDVHRQEITYRSKSDFKRTQFVSGTFGLVAVRADAEQGGDNIMRFKTGTNLRACTSDVCLEDAPHKGPGAMTPDDYWKSRAGHHGTWRVRYDREKGKRWGKLTVRHVWHEVTCNNVEGFEDKCLIIRWGDSTRKRVHVHAQQNNKTAMKHAPPPPPPPSPPSSPLTCTPESDRDRASHLPACAQKNGL